MIKPPVEQRDDAIVATSDLIKLISEHDDAEHAALESERAIRKQAHILRAQITCNPPERIAVILHKRSDEATDAQDRKHPATLKQVPCKRGCTACCYQLVSVSEPEAMLAMSAARAVGHEIDFERARLQAATASDYNALAHADRRCVMLRDDGDCAIYRDRPIACRSYRVVNDPELCDVDKHPHGGTLTWASITVQVLISASMRTFRHGSLASFIAEGSEP